MFKIENVEKTACPDSPYITLERLRYQQDGVPRQWDMARVHDSVAILLVHRERHSVILVRQFRPPVYLQDQQGVTWELCAGLMDKGISPEQTASEEILEETGYRVAAEELVKINSFFTAVSFAGSRQVLYFAEVDSSRQVNAGGGVEGESIQVVELPFAEVPAFISNDRNARTPGILYALMWLQQQPVYRCWQESC